MLKPFKKLMMLTTVAVFAIAGCRQQMADQPHQRPLEASNFFDDGMASRPIEPGTVARAGKEQADQQLNAKLDGKLVDAFGDHGVKRLDLAFPVIMAVDSSGRLYVAGRDRPVCPRLLGTQLTFSVYRLNG